MCVNREATKTGMCHFQGGEKFSRWANRKWLTCQSETQTAGYSPKPFVENKAKKKKKEWKNAKMFKDFRVVMGKPPGEELNCPDTWKVWDWRALLTPQVWGWPLWLGALSEVRYTDGMLPQVFLLTLYVEGEYLAGEFSPATYILKFLSPRLNFWSWVTRWELGIRFYNVKILTSYTTKGLRSVKCPAWEESMGKGAGPCSLWRESRVNSQTRSSFCCSSNHSTAKPVWGPHLCRPGCLVVPSQQALLGRSMRYGWT